MDGVHAVLQKVNAQSPASTVALSVLPQLQVSLPMAIYVVLSVAVI